jgi:hypothetical protein
MKEALGSWKLKEKTFIGFHSICLQNGEWKEEASCFGWVQLPQHST